MAKSVNGPPHNIPAIPAVKTIVDISRRQRRDFYLVADIELPPTLTVGGYQLKVTLVDETTGAEDAALIPIDIVADRSALAYGR